MASIGMLLIDLPFWLIVGMIAGLFNMIPLIGPWVGAVPGIVIAFTTGGGISKAIAVAVVMAIVQQIDNHFISPIVMQRAVKLHPAVVMLALLAGGTLAGFIGLLLAVPAAATLKIVCRPRCGATTCWASRSTRSRPVGRPRTGPGRGA